MMRIFAQNSFIDGKFQPATIEVSGDLISGIELGPVAASKEVEIRYDRGYLVPGLIDLQLNGVAGVDFSSGSKEQIQVALAALPAKTKPDPGLQDLVLHNRQPSPN